MCVRGKSCQIQYVDEPASDCYATKHLGSSHLSMSTYLIRSSSSRRADTVPHTLTTSALLPSQLMRRITIQRILIIITQKRGGQLSLREPSRTTDLNLAPFESMIILIHTLN